MGLRHRKGIPGKWWRARAEDNIQKRRVPVSADRIVREAMSTIDKRYDRKENITGVPTGFHDIDIMTAGLQSGDLIILASRPSMGKSALACNMMSFAAITENMPVLYFTLSESKHQIAERMLCSIAGVNAHKVRTGFFSQPEWPKLVKAARTLSETPIFIDDTPGISAVEISNKARYLKEKEDIGLIVVDYLQLMKGSAESKNRQQAIEEILSELKKLAEELNVPVLVLSQLSRAVERRQDKRPQLSDLRGSGAIEQDADLVMLLLREEYYDPTEENRGLAEVIIPKQRRGPVGVVRLAFLSEFCKFVDLESMKA